MGMKKENYRAQIKDAERRYFQTPVEIRDDSDGKRYIEGTPIVVERETDLGYFTEIISKDATKGLIENNDIRVLRDHDSRYLLGRSNKGKGTAKLTRDSNGNISYRVEVRENRPALLATYDEVMSGDLDGGSFAFIIESEEITTPTRDNGLTKPQRRINSFQAIYDVGPVVYPAYQDTTAAARSIEKVEEQEGQLIKKIDLQKKERQKRLRELKLKK